MEYILAKASDRQQDIADRLEAMNQERRALEREIFERQKTEIRELQARCGDIGHVFAKTFMSWDSGRVCAVCRFPEPLTDKARN
jgi:single-stranded DNA-specific DHH superfamily exonuclease